MPDREKFSGAKYVEGRDILDEEYESVHGLQNLADGVYGTTERTKQAADRIRKGEMKPGDLDRAFGHL